jgi:predicted dehydrogenase
MKKRYKATVIGCGWIGAENKDYSKIIQPATHAGAYKSHPRIELAALVDINPKKLSIARKLFPGIPSFNSAREMFKKIKPDIVSIATPTNSHSRLVQLAARFKTKAIVCEKPISNSLKEAEKMIKVCQDNKSLLFINHQRRFDPLIRKWRDKVKTGLIGNILQASCYYYNGLLNNGTHSIDLLRFFLGEISWVQAITNLKTSVSKNDKNVDALIGFRNNVRATMQSLSKNYGFANFYFYGTRGRIAIKNLGYEIEYRKLIKNKYYKNRYQLSGPIKQMGETRSFMGPMANHVVNCLEKRERPISSGEDGLTALKIILALKKSAKNNCIPIKLRK